MAVPSPFPHISASFSAKQEKFTIFILVHLLAARLKGKEAFFLLANVHVKRH